MKKHKQMSVTEYAESRTNRAYRKADTDKQGISRQYILAQIKANRLDLLPGVISAEMIGKTYVLTVKNEDSNK